MNYPPKEWGPYMWNLLHILSIHPKSSTADYKEFFNSISLILPCHKCKQNYSTHLKALPMPNDKTKFLEWLIKVHNRINISTNKSEQSVDEMISFWKEKYKSVNSIHDIQLIELIEYLIHSHPGFYKVTPDYIHAHQVFWKIIQENLNTSDIHLLKNVPLSTETISHKQLYLNWLLKIKNIYSVTIPFRGKQCTSYCMSLLN